MLGIIPDLVVILLIAAAILWANKLPEIGKGIGQEIKEFKESLSGTN
jgi:TatA/E family protein of Tat protein translocase